MKNSKSIVVSVCMITYNQENYIQKAIDGVLMQNTEFEIELIIGEDCSTDKTRIICAEYQKQFPQIIKLKTYQKNIGMIPNLIETLNACTGEYIAICEGDDYWTDPLKLQNQVDAMEEYPDCLISCHAGKVLSAGGEVTRWYHSDKVRLFSVKNVLKIPGQFAPTSSYLLKTSAIKEFPQWFKTVPVGDFFLEVLTSVKGGILYIPKTMSTYRNNASASWSERTLRDLSNIKVLKYYNEMEKHLKLLIDYLPRDYKSYVNMKMAATIYGKALYYLANSNYELFRKEIEESYLIYKNVSPFTKLIYFFRFFGPLAKLIYLNKVKFYNA
jgi:glycosyltransferase involved in cell wall biosynthesis